jgi:hypothetical protein
VEASAAPLATLETTRSVRTALKRLDGTATVGDVAAETGLAQAEAEAALRDLLEHYQGHLAVGDRGDLLYRFDPKFLERDHAPTWVRIRETAWDVFKALYKVSVAVVLVVYVVIFVALAIAAIVAANKDGDGGDIFEGGGGDRRGGGGFGGLGDLLFWYWIWNPNWGWGRPYYGDRYGLPRDRRDRLARAQRPPFYKKVFAYVFGPDRPEDTPERRDRQLLRLARARGGVLAPADLVQATGMGLQEAEEELARLMVAHDGEAEATEGGVVHTFPQLMVSADTDRADRRPPPAWRRLEPDLPLTGNSTGSNVAITLLNGFNLVAALSAPFTIFPALGISGAAAWIGLSIFPAAFSASFFAIPLLRRFGVRRENRKRRERNVRRTLLGLLTRASLEGDEAGRISETEAIRTVREALGEKYGKPKRVRDAIDRFIAEFDGEVDVDAEGATHYRFPGFRTAIETAIAIRERARLSRGVGSIVYDSGDDAREAAERDLAAFDDTLSAGSPLDALEGPDVDEVGDGRTLYLDDPTRFAYRDELELAAMEEIMRQRGKATVGR